MTRPMVGIWISISSPVATGAPSGRSVKVADDSEALCSTQPKTRSRHRTAARWLTAKGSRGRGKQTRMAQNKITMAPAAHSRLNRSSGETSLAADGDKSDIAMPPADEAATQPKSRASFQRTRDRDRSPPLSVTRKGRPNGRTAALSKAAEIAKAVTASVTSAKYGRVRGREIQKLYIQRKISAGTPYLRNDR